MTIETALNKAVEGGWIPPTVVDADEIPAAVRFYAKAPHRALLDPAFFRALGKTENVKGLGVHENDWALAKMHRLIDHLADGGSIESFFANL